MKTGVRIAVCVMMMAIALTMVVFTAAGFRKGETESFLLGEYGGNVAVYSSGEERALLRVTDIALASLPGADREKLGSGIAVAGERELQELLEDLGS